MSYTKIDEFKLTVENKKETLKINNEKRITKLLHDNIISYLAFITIDYITDRISKAELKNNDLIALFHDKVDDSDNINRTILNDPD